MGGSNWPTTSIRLVGALRRPEDRVAWERFSTEYAPALLEFCGRYNLQSADAEDIVQAVFLGTHRTIKNLEFSPDRGHFRSWLSTIALRAIWKFQERRRTRDCDLMDPVQMDELQAKQQELTAEINESVLKLAVDEVQPDFDPLTWVAFSAVWFDGERPQDVAARLCRTTGWVYKAKFNVLQKLKSVIRRMAHELDEL